MLDKNISEDKTEAELAQEFKEYLNLIGKEISDPLKEQVKKQSDYVDHMSKAIEKLENELQKDMKRSLQQLNEQVITVYSNQQKNIDKRLDEIQQSLQNNIESYDKKLNERHQSLLNIVDSYEKKTTQRLMKHRWIETLLLITVIAVGYFYNNALLFM